MPVIVITAYGSSHSAIEAVRLGAYDFVTKPFDLDEIVLTAERALDHAALNREVIRLHSKEWSRLRFWSGAFDWHERPHAGCFHHDRQSGGNGFDGI